MYKISKRSNISLFSGYDYDRLLMFRYRKEAWETEEQALLLIASSLISKISQYTDKSNVSMLSTHHYQAEWIPYSAKELQKGTNLTLFTPCIPTQANAPATEGIAFHWGNQEDLTSISCDIWLTFHLISIF